MNTPIKINLVSGPVTPLRRSFVSVCEAVNRNVRSGVGPRHRNLSLEHGYRRSVVMVFAKRLREGVLQGKIACSVRIWTRPHVKEGKRYRIGEAGADAVMAPKDRGRDPSRPAEVST
jgi:hypothetical protein